MMLLSYIASTPINLQNLHMKSMHGKLSVFLPLNSHGKICYSWSSNSSHFLRQQRHRSKLATPLPKEVMFKGNPREPGQRSFENVRFALDAERMSRLRTVWKSSAQTSAKSMEALDDEWIVTHLSSDAVTGLQHEIEVLVSLGLLSTDQNGLLCLAQGWERRVPHSILNEMRDEWSADVHNFFCIHDRIKSSLGERWEEDEDGWRWAEDDDELVYDDEEYDMRKQIFIENHLDWAQQRGGMGGFGV